MDRYIENFPTDVTEAAYKVLKKWKKSQGSGEEAYQNICAALEKANLPCYICHALKMLHVRLQPHAQLSRTKCGIRAVVATWSTLMSLLPRCTWAPTKRHSSPVEAVLSGSEVALPGLVEMPKFP